LFFSVIDSPDSDRLFDLSLSVGQHCYGLNLANTVLMVQQDTEINRQHEDRFQISGLVFEGRPLSGMPAQRAAGLKILTDLIAGWYPVESRPRIIDSFVSHGFGSFGAMTLPHIVFVFADCQIASQVRARVFSHVRLSPLPAIRKIWVEPVLTKATYVRMRF
jgi:hypothetical protein